MKKSELVFVPSPGVGHLVPAVEIAKLMVNRDDRLSITVLVMKHPPLDTKINEYIKSVSASISDHIRFVYLPSEEQTNSGINFLSLFIESQKPHVKNVVSKLVQSESSSESPQLAGFVVGMFCTTMIDVADEFGVPSYIFFASSAVALSLMLYMQALNDEKNVDTTEFKDSDAEFMLPGIINPVPAKVLPSVVFNKDWHPIYFGNARRFKEAEGIMINTFLELESHVINVFSDGKTPPLYPIGPILNLKGDGHDVGSAETNKNKDIMEWLDGQPPSSVVFLCFGSMGSFGEEQVKEIACALEQSGYRFLWSLRQPPPKGKMGFPSDYASPEEALPIGFLDRMAEIGKVIGWAPQVAILSHPAIGGFVSHCGWNSILESLWFGVPIAAWPLFSEQQLNAFEMMIELGLAVEIKMDYRKDFRAENEMVVSGDIIEKGIRSVMEQDSEIRKKVKAMSEVSKKALLDGGSSHSSIGRLIEDVLNHMK
ncbi:unnamed protein product [Dovyalis caffra]|uniref:Glycosyltransferase n=1 Tax=Dovyalis caffra TaxID=77055 RepID=A0AAV1S6A0_9ROSI|nr:unnamed protein product [Dovyalis caffra]